MTKDEQGYNGWTNYETWNVSLWLGNDEGSYQMVNEMAEEADDAYELAQAIKEFILENDPLYGEAGLYQDLLGAALSEVDWDEIARHWWEDERQEEEAS